MRRNSPLKVVDSDRVLHTLDLASSDDFGWVTGVVERHGSLCR